MQQMSVSGKFQQEIRETDAQIASVLWQKIGIQDRVRYRDIIRAADPELLDSLPEIKNWTQSEESHSITT